MCKLSQYVFNLAQCQWKGAKQNVEMKFDAVRGGHPLAWLPEGPARTPHSFSVLVPAKYQLRLNLDMGGQRCGWKQDRKHEATQTLAAHDRFNPVGSQRLPATFIIDECRTSDWTIDLLEAQIGLPLTSTILADHCPASGSHSTLHRGSNGREVFTSGHGRRG